MLLAIEKLGYAVSIRTSGQGMLNVLQSQADATDLVSYSMALRDFSGKTLFAKVYEIKADMPVILITEHTSGTDLEMFENIGIKGTIYNILEVFPEAIFAYSVN